MRVIKVKKDQSLADIALQEYGHIEGVFFLVRDNRHLNGITDTIYPEEELIIRNEKINYPMQQFLLAFELATAKNAQGEGIGYWSINHDFKIS